MGESLKKEAPEAPGKNEKNFEDIHTLKSSLPGFLGFFETLLRRFKNLSFLLLLSPIVLLYCFCLGVALTPGVLLYQWVERGTSAWPFLYHSLALAFSLGLGFILYGFTLILVVPIVNFPLIKKVTACRSTWYSLKVIPWYYHNALTYLVRYTFLELMTPTPLNLFFYRSMGMKIGKGVVINTTHISDPCLINLEDYVTIGGSATLMAHYGMKGFLIVGHLHVKKGSTIGLKASLMGDVIVGENCMVRPHAVILPKTRVPDNTQFLG